MNSRLDTQETVAGEIMEAIHSIVTGIKLPFMGKFMNDKAIAKKSLYIARLYCEKLSDDDLKNYLALRALKGILVGHFNNVHKQRDRLGLGVDETQLVIKAYAFAELMLQEREAALQAIKEGANRITNEEPE